MEEAAGAGFGWAAVFGAEPLGATGVVACATRVGAAFGAAGAVAGVASATSIGAAASAGARGRLARQPFGKTEPVAA